MTVRCTALAGDQSRDPTFDVEFLPLWITLTLIRVAFDVKGQREMWEERQNWASRWSRGGVEAHGQEIAERSVPKSHDNCRSRSSGRRNQDAFSPENLIHFHHHLHCHFLHPKKIQIRKCRFYANFSIVCIFVEIWIIRLRRRCCAGSIFHATLICSRLQNSAAHYQTKPTVTELNFKKKIQFFFLK